MQDPVEYHGAMTMMADEAGMGGDGSAAAAEQYFQMAEGLEEAGTEEGFYDYPQEGGMEMVTPEQRPSKQARYTGPQGAMGQFMQMAEEMDPGQLAAIMQSARAEVQAGARQL